MTLDRWLPRGVNLGPFRFRSGADVPGWAGAGEALRQRLRGIRERLTLGPDQLTPPGAPEVRGRIRERLRALGYPR